MRTPIEFKGWDKQTKNWLKLNEFNQWYNERCKLWREFFDNHVELIQYVGIKDIHKEKVFRGDIIRVKRIIYTDCSKTKIDRIKEFIGEIVWYQYSWVVVEKNKKGLSIHFLWTWKSETDTMEIITNRWDNPTMSVMK